MRSQKINEEINVQDAELRNDEEWEVQEADEIMVFKLSLEELLQTAEETQAEGAILQDLIDNFIASLSSNNSESFAEAIKKILEHHPEHKAILANVKADFEKYKDQIKVNNLPQDDDFCHIKDSKLCQVKIQVEEILNIWGNDQEGAKRIADNLMDDEKELRQVLAKFNTNIDTRDSARVEALTGLNLYIQQKAQAPRQLQRETKAHLLDANLLADCRIEMDKILTSWELNPNHAKRAIDGLMQRNTGVFYEVLTQITDEKKDEMLTPLNNLKLYLESKINPHQEEIQEEGEEGDIVEDENESPEKKGFFSRLFS